MPSELEHVSEPELIELALANSDGAFGELVMRYEKSLYNVVFGVVGDAEVARDVTQDTFLRAHQFLDRYRKSFRFSTWLFRIGVNLGISRLRRNRLESEVFSARGIAHYGLLRGGGDSSPIDEVLREERAQQVLEGIRDLSDRYRTVLLMRYRDGMACRDIGRELGISANSVSIILHRAKAKLKEFLEAGEEA